MSWENVLKQHVLQGNLQPEGNKIMVEGRDMTENIHNHIRNMNKGNYQGWDWTENLKNAGFNPGSVTIKDIDMNSLVYGEFLNFLRSTRSL